jgi:hypothetical protein
MNVSLQPDPIWSWPLLALVAVAMFVLVVGVYRPRLAHLPASRRRLLLCLRLATWAVLVFCMARPFLELKRTDKHASVYFVVADRSRSMGVRDGSAGQTRREALLQLLADVESELSAIGKEVELRLFDFDKELIAVEARSFETPGEQTAIGYILDAIPRLAQGKRIAGMLLLTDGAQRAVSPFDVDPRAAASRLADALVRVDTVPFGCSGLSQSAVDLIAEDLEVSPTVFVKNTVVVSAKIRALGAADKDLTVRLLLEDHGSAVPGQPTKMQSVATPIKIRTSRNEDVLPVEMNFVAQDPGEFRLTLAVDPLEGEPLTVNNSQTTFITVLKGGISVACFDDALHPEHKFLRRIDESPDIQIDFKPVRSAARGSQTFDPAWFQRGRYDVYLIGSVPAEMFGKEALARIAANVEQGAGLMMYGGRRSFGPGGYAETPLADLMPIDMLRTETQTGDDIDPTLHYTEPLQMIPTPLGLQHFVMRIDTAAKNSDRWKSLPPLDGANRFRLPLKGGALPLAVAQNGAPLLVAQEVGRARTMAFAGDTTYHWYLAGHHDEHQRFWQQAIMWLAHKDVQGDESVWIKLDTRRLRTGQPIGMAFGARDPDKRPIDDAEFKVEVIGPENKQFPVTPQRTGTDHTARFTETQAPGEYRVRVDAVKDGKPIGFTAESRFIVFEQDLELTNPAADLALLDEIARMTGGVQVPPEQLAAHLRKLLKSGLNAEVTELRRIPLWDNEYVIGLFALLLTLEWFLRKRRGMV